jgi:UrcA family protein
MHKLSLTLALALLASAPASAADGHSWKVGNDSFHVYYHDLDMNTAEGRAAALKRIDRAARRLCEQPLRVDEEACVAATLAAAAQGPRGAPLKLAIAERDGVRMAGR